ncbi:MAG TPA: GNAT family N-acetyltransferase [Caldithrix abyssi]|uniref:GNAT family N-acetyltransferase n=1 Tax=Caldithrix abyssi TaxID=187145 RepID=A0A7V5PMC4_CALAY|nr:GNAT family N-acetyltransferase [Caldithrix abyssi]
MATNGADYRVKLLTETEFSLWDDFVSRSLNGTLFHTTRWAELVRSVFGRSFKIVAVQKKERLVAGMLIWPRTVAGKWWLSQAPVTPYQGLVLKRPDSDKPSSVIARQLHLTGLMAEYLKEKIAFADISFSPLVNDLRPFLWNGFSAQPRYTYRFEITEWPELQARFSQALRRKLKAFRAKPDAIVSANDPQALIEFVTASYRRHGSDLPVGQEQLRRVFQHVLERKMGQLFYLLENGTPVAGLLALQDDRHVFTYFAGVSSAARADTHTEALYFHLLDQPEARAKTFDFLGADLPDFDQFKRSFGGRLCVYFQLQYQANLLTRSVSAVRRGYYLRKRRRGGDAR